MILHYDRVLGNLLWAMANTPGIAPQDRGELLESLVAYILMTQGRFEVRRNITTIDAQIDMLVRNLNVLNPMLEALGTYILVEAKMWETPAGAPVVKKFIMDLRSASCHSGILVSRAGVTGAAGNADALHTIRKHYQKDNVVVIVLEAQDVQALVDLTTPLDEMLVQKYEDIRLEVP
jgi:hypothetical protein